MAASGSRFLVGAWLANTAAVEYSRIVVTGQPNRAAWPGIRQRLEHAVRLDGTVARWYQLLGLVTYRQGSVDRAVSALERAAVLSPAEPRVWAALGDAYDAFGKPSRAAEAYERGAPYSNQARWLVSHLSSAEAGIEKGDLASARGHVDQALRLDPDNIWAWHELTRAPLGPTPEAVRHVRQYRLSYAADRRLGRFMALAAEGLLHEGAWAVDDGLNVVRVLLLRHQPTEAAMVLRVLQSLAAVDARVAGAGAEITAQSGSPAEAAALWEEIARRETGPRMAICAAALQRRMDGDWPRARTDYETCLRDHPDDQPSLKGLAEACNILADAACARTAAERLSALSPEAVVAQSLNVRRETVSLGPDLVINGGFEEADLSRPWLPKYWDMGVWDGYKNDRAAFYVDTDRRSWSGQAAAFVLGLWRRQTELPSGAYAELFASPTLLPARAAYVLSFYYKTDDLHGLILARDGRDDASTFRDAQLPGTDGLWKQVVVVAANPLAEATYMRPQLRLWGSGAAWFDQVQVRLLLSPGMVQPAAPPSVR